MKRTTTLAVWTLLVSVIATLSAHADQLRDGLLAFKRHDYTAAAPLLRSPADYGDPRAQSVLCYMYTYGRGLPQNYQEAASWCQRAANQGNPEAQYMLGLLYNKGHGVPEDFIEAYKWLNLAATRASGPKRDFSYRIRDSVATKMSPRQISKAQAQAMEWRPILEVQNSESIASKCNGKKKCSRSNAIVPK